MGKAAGQVKEQKKVLLARTSALNTTAREIGASDWGRSSTSL